MLKLPTSHILQKQILQRLHRYRLFLIGLPIILFCLPLLATGDSIAPGDGDYIMQTYEAARISMLEYGQFPWWNPWISGGVPLYANPQYGLISVQSLTTLVFGSVFGYKIALVFYFLLGFYGLYILFTRAFRTPTTTALLLAYIWTFGSFLTHRASGHYTFFTIQFFPLMLYFFLRRKEYKYSWLWLGLVAGLMANSAAHNTTIMSFFVIALFGIFGIFGATLKATTHEVVTKITVEKQDVLNMGKALGVFLIVASHRLYYTFQYARDFPREFSSPETTIGVPKALYALFGPINQFQNTPSHPTWSWQEASAYIGVLTLVAFITVLALYVKRKGQSFTRLPDLSPTLILGLISLFFLLALGNFAGRLSPYHILDIIPVVSEMRVTTRWLFWCALMILYFIALYTGQKYRKIINTILLISVIELFIGSVVQLAKPYVIEYKPRGRTSAVISQQEHFNVDRLGISYDENLTETTSENIGQVVAGDALIDTRFEPPFGESSIRCDEDDRCPFVLTDNADVITWSPNRIKLQRNAAGVIRLNTNPGDYWTINGRYAFPGYRKAEPNFTFDIPSTEEGTIVLEYVPRYSFKWLVQKVF